MRDSAKTEVRGFIHRSKDAALAITARVAINKWLNSIGKMTELSIDTKNKRIWVRLDLTGEKEPIETATRLWKRMSNTERVQATIAHKFMCGGFAAEVKS